MKGHAAIPGPGMIKYPLQSFNEYLKMISFMHMPTTFSSFIRDIEIVSLLLRNSNIILAVRSDHPLSLRLRIYDILTETSLISFFRENQIFRNQFGKCSPISNVPDLLRGTI